MDAVGVVVGRRRVQRSVVEVVVLTGNVFAAAVSNVMVTMMIFAIRKSTPDESATATSDIRRDIFITFAFYLGTVRDDDRAP